MFTSLSLIKSYPVPEDDRKTLFYLFSLLENLPQFEWMKLTGWRSVEYFYCYGMNSTNGVMGAYLAFQKNKVFLLSGNGDMSMEEVFAQTPMRKLSDHPALSSTWAGVIAGTAVHELYHRYQRLRFGPVKYLFCSLPGIRQFVLEPDADKYGKQAAEVFDRIIAQISAEEAEKRFAQNRSEYEG